MKVEFGKGVTDHGPGVSICLEGAELATAILAYLTSHNVYHGGPLTVFANGKLCDHAEVYVFPAEGWVIHEGVRYTGRGEIEG